MWDSCPRFLLWTLLWRKVNWGLSNVFNSWVISLFPLFLVCYYCQEKYNPVCRGRDKQAKLLQSSTLSYTLINPWLTVNVFPLCLLILWRTPRCGWSVTLALVQLMPAVLALLCFALRGLSSDLCHIKMRCVITEVRCNGSVQQEECLSFLYSLALMSWRVNPVLLCNAQRQLGCSFAAIAELLLGSRLTDQGLRVSRKLQLSFLVQRKTKPLQGLRILAAIIWPSST